MKQRTLAKNLEKLGLTQLKHHLIKLHRALNPKSKHSSMRCSNAGLDHYIGRERGNAIGLDIYSNWLGKILGLKLCKSPNVCPKCSQIVGIARAILIGRWAVDEKKLGNILVLLTLTLQHQLADILDDLLTELNMGSVRMRQANKFRAFFKRIKYVQQIESPCSRKTGWHPHKHMLLSIPPDIDLSILDEIVDYWIKYHKKRGNYASPLAQDIEIISDPKTAGQYIAKVFKAGFEITSSSTKTDSESLLYHELLFHSETDPFCAARAKEYFETIQGRQLFRKSIGLDLDKYDDEEYEDEDDDEYEKPEKISAFRIIIPRIQPVIDVCIVIESLRFNPAQAPPDHQAQIEAAFRKHKIIATVEIRHEDD